MTGFASVGDYVDAMLEGRAHSCSFRKVPSQISTAGWWADLSMAAGNPPPNYYAASPLIAATLDSYRGIFHGPDQSPASKHLTRLCIVTPTAAAVGQYLLLDYLLFYPFVDGDEADVQTMDNTVTLPRYTDGDGVQAMAVAVAPTTGSGQFTFEYVNQDGVTRTSPTQFCSTASANIASIVTSQQAVVQSAGPFLRLASGDTGIRQVNSVQFSVANGGLFALVLVKPLTQIAVCEINTPIDVEYLYSVPTVPRIESGAYLNLIVNCAGSIASAQIVGHAHFCWST